MKLINYQCNNIDCNFEHEDIVKDEEEVKSTLVESFCPMCGGLLKLWNVKNMLKEQK